MGRIDGRDAMNLCARRHSGRVDSGSDAALWPAVKLTDFDESRGPAREGQAQRFGGSIAWVA